MVEKRVGFLRILSIIMMSFLIIINLELVEGNQSTSDEDSVLKPNFCTYFGDQNQERIRDVTVGSDGYAYITGSKTGGSLFYSKIKEDGSSIEYNYNYGGSEGDYGSCIALDKSGRIWIGGYTYSSDFPITDDAYQNEKKGEHDLVILRISNSTGDIEYSTYFGGSDHEEVEALYIDDDGFVYLTGKTKSNDFPTLNAFCDSHNRGYDCFVIKLNQSGYPVYSTFIGGFENECGYDITTDSNGSIYVTGMTASGDFPTFNAFDDSQNGGSYYGDCFLVKFNANGSDLIFSTYIGGVSFEMGESILVDDQGYVFLTGSTYSQDFPLVNPYDDTLGEINADCFIMKLFPNGTSIQYSTFLGGSNGDHGHSLILDEFGNIYVGGDTTSPDFPLKDPIVENCAEKIHSGFLVRFNSNFAILEYSTYLGGVNKYDRINAIARGSSGNIIVVGDTESPEFFILNALDDTLSGGYDGFIAGFVYNDTISPNFEYFPIDRVVELGSNFNYDLNASDFSGIDDWWLNTTDFDIDERGTITNSVIMSVGVYWIEVSVNDTWGNNQSAIFKVTVVDTTAPVWDPEPVGQVVELGANLNYDLNATDLSLLDTWWLNNTNFNITKEGIVHFASVPSVGTFILLVSVNDTYGNILTGVLNVTVQDSINPSWNPQPTDRQLEYGSPFSYDLDAVDASTIQWTINDTINFSINASGIITNATILSLGDYWLEVIAADPYGNSVQVSFKITVQDTIFPIFIGTPDDVEAEEGITVILVWNVSDLCPKSYNISLEDELLENGEWNTSMTSIVVSIGGFELGEYDITITLVDCGGNIAKDTVRVRITEINMSTPTTTVTSDANLLLLSQTMGIIVIIILAITIYIFTRRYEIK